MFPDIPLSPIFCVGWLLWFWQKYSHFPCFFFSSFTPTGRHQTLVCVCPIPRSQPLPLRQHFSSSELLQIGQRIPNPPFLHPLDVLISEAISLIFYCKNVGCGINLLFFFSIINLNVCSEVGNKASNRYFGRDGPEPRLSQSFWSTTAFLILAMSGRPAQLWLPPLSSQCSSPSEITQPRTQLPGHLEKSNQVYLCLGCVLVSGFLRERLNHGFTHHN